MAISATQYDIVRATWSPSSGGGVGARAVITAPDATTFTVTATSASAIPNLWTIWFAVPQAGTYLIAWSAVSGSGTFNDTAVAAAYSAPQLLTISDCYQSLNIPTSRLGVDPDRDADMLTYAQAALGVVEGIIGPVVPTFVSQIFDGGNGSVKLAHAAGTILNVIENGQSIFDWVFDPIGSLLRAGTTWWNRPFWPGIQNVEVQYMAGQGPVAPNTKLAVREEFRFLWEQGRQGGHAGFNEQIISTSAVPQGFAIPNRVYELLSRVDQLPGFA